jgi:AcrR family transcriptional regulator
MPKRIPNLSETILACASSLFSKDGYDSVDMKQVAAEAGTSVGNLYNYFKSKPALFVAVKGLWKSKLMDDCRVVLLSDLPRRERILAVLHTFYDNISGWHGLWMEFVAGREGREHLHQVRAKTDKHQWTLAPEEMELVAMFDALLLGQVKTEPPYRWGFLLITATVQLATRHAQYRDDNWKFLETLVDKI